MNSSALVDSMKIVEKMLKELNLLKEKNMINVRNPKSNKYSAEFIQVSTDDQYEKIYRTAMEKSDYDFLLIDDSFFQFSCNHNVNSMDIRYAFFHNPRYYCTYEEYLKKTGFNLDDCGSEFISFYEQEISEAKLKSSILPIRYDYNLSQYVPLKHPISHLHIGQEENFRFALGIILTAPKFVNFVIRNIYYEHWKDALENDTYKEICLLAKKTCSPLKSDVLSDDEKKLLYIL